MSQFTTWASDRGLSVRKNRDNGNTQGQGKTDRLYVGRYGDFDYDSFVDFAVNWSGVGRIVKAILYLTTEDGLSPDGIFPKASKSPHIVVRRNTGAWDQGDDNTTWKAADYTAPSSYTTTGQRSVDVTRAHDTLVAIDVTAIVNGIAPKTVVRSDTKRVGTFAGTFRGLLLMGTSSTDEEAAFWSESATETSARPYIVLEYEFGKTTPSTPTNLTPVGSVASIGSFQGDFADPRPEDYLKYSEVEVYDGGHAGTSATDDWITSTLAHGLKAKDTVYFTALSGGAGLSTFTRYYVLSVSGKKFKVKTTLAGTTAVNITDGHSSLTWRLRVYTKKKEATNTEATNGRSNHVPDNLSLVRNVNYAWRVRFYDQEAQVSAWTSLTTFLVTNTDPDAPTLTPLAAVTSTLDGVTFEGTFSDDDAGDTLLAYQIQMSEFEPESASWDEPSLLIWDTDKIYVAADATAWASAYGGRSVDTGVYYWRARVWDNHDGVSAWTYTSIELTADFEQEPGQQTEVQMRPNAPWRLVIKAMGTLRGPGATVAIFNNAKSVGASIMYNSPGEAHWTLPPDDPQISVVEPKQTHYSIQFYTGDGWREVFAGLVWDYDATETDIVFYGIDYLALYDKTYDEKYDPFAPDKPAEKGGSFYVSSGKNTISYIIADQLKRAKALPNSPVGFITVGSIASMTTTAAVYSTFQPTLPFITSLLDSHRQGQGTTPRVWVRPKTGGGYEVVTSADPGETKDNLRLRYGELVSGYRVVPFGQGWGTRAHGVGRAMNGVKPYYTSQTSNAINEDTWGRFASINYVEGIADEADLKRRVRQIAKSNSKLGRQLGIAVRTGTLQPRDGYDVCDEFPVAIKHGPIDTDNFGSGYWKCLGVAWELSDIGQPVTILTLLPREDDDDPDTDLLTLQPISTVDEWTEAFVPPSPITATSKYWLDRATGLVYVRDTDQAPIDITGTAEE